jgi:hypothetical protein
LIREAKPTEVEEGACCKGSCEHDDESKILAPVVIRLHGAKGSTVPFRRCDTVHHCFAPEIA